MPLAWRRYLLWPGTERIINGDPFGFQLVHRVIYTTRQVSTGALPRGQQLWCTTWAAVQRQASGKCVLGRPSSSLATSRARV